VSGAACIFCRIVARETEASIVCEDDATLAFMDLRQFNAGHALVVPKSHMPDIFALDEAAGGALMATVAGVARAVRAAFSSEGISIWQSNGAAAGQEVPHLHAHVARRTTGGRMLRVFARRLSGGPSRTELDDQAAAIRAAL
jgi:histidine triad (HIT) family protein